MTELVAQETCCDSKAALRRTGSVAHPARAQWSLLSSPTGCAELHLSVEAPASGTFDDQLRAVEAAYRQALAAAGTDLRTAVLRRFFCSDVTNQAPLLRASPLLTGGEPEFACATSVVGQPPASGAKLALWAFHLLDPAGPLRKAATGDSLILQRGLLTHHWTCGLVDTSAGAHAQTARVVDGYVQDLKARGMSLDDHVMRTWFFVRDIDANYHGLVNARRSCFAKHGLTPATHFIASTGIGSDTFEPRTLVMLDAYAIEGIRPEQVRHLSAPDHLCPTHDYGVTFERATAIDHRDRTHIIVSGTASIDRRGQIVHPGDVEQQLNRTLENIEALLAQGEAGVSDVSHWIVYLRDRSDYARIAPHLRQRLGSAPTVVVAAPVCRPGWLIEIECQATRTGSHPGLPAY